MYLGKVGNIRSANAWLAYSADTPAPHTLEFLLVFHFVIFSEKSPFVDIETVFGKIHIYILIYILHFWTSGNACVSPFPFDVTARISAFYFAYVHIEYLLVTHIGHFAGICIWTLAWMSTSGLCQLSWLLCTGIHPIGKKRRDKKNQTPTSSWSWAAAVVVSVQWLTPCSLAPCQCLGPPYTWYM